VSEYENYGEREERDAYEAGAYERELAADELEHTGRERTDALRRDWPVREERDAA
jgi:hypothetical protein